MKGKNVIQFDKIITVIKREETDLPEPTMNVIEVERTGKPYCRHEQVDLFIHHRLLKCKNCLATLDPYGFVFQLAREGNNHISQIKWLRYQVKDIEKQKADLEREVQNLKAQKRKWS